MSHIGIKLSVGTALMHGVAGAALSFVILGSAAHAQTGAFDPANYAWQAGAIRHAQQMRTFVDRDSGQQPTPPVIQGFEIDFDPFGELATVQPGGPTQTSQNAFF